MKRGKTLPNKGELDKRSADILAWQSFYESKGLTKWQVIDMTTEQWKALRAEFLESKK